MIAFSPVTHVLFDMDGLLLDTSEIYTTAFQNVVSKFGKNYDWEIKVKLMGLQMHEIADFIIASLAIPMSRDEFIEESNGHLIALSPDTKLLPGVRRLVEHLHKHNIPMGLATSSCEESYKLKTQNHGELFSLFSYKTFGSDPDVEKGKPAPDTFLVAASKFPDKPAPAQCLVFEDAVNGVKAAKAAGMQVVMVPDTRLDKNLTNEATLVLNSLDEFKPEAFGLPSFED